MSNKTDRKPIDSAPEMAESVLAPSSMEWDLDAPSSVSVSAAKPDAGQNLPAPDELDGRLSYASSEPEFPKNMQNALNWWRFKNGIVD